MLHKHSITYSYFKMLHLTGFHFNKNVKVLSEALMMDCIRTEARLLPLGDILLNKSCWYVTLLFTFKST
jgi:hypothetical protein